MSRLQNQLRDLNKKLREETDSDDDAKTKQLQEELIQAQIATVEAEIQKLQNKSADKTTEQISQSSQSTQAKKSGGLLDTYA